ncbi:MAG: YraN family protein [Candidatus Limnocylindria bacterium]
MPDDRRALGDLGETQACRFLERRGARILERGARTRYGEIDIVCRDARGYLFVEVKTRRAGSFVRAVEAVHARKLARLAALAQAWLALHGRRDASWRIALVAITVGPEGAGVELIELD